MLKQRNTDVITVKPGDQDYLNENGVIRINPAKPESYEALFKELIEHNRLPGKIIHLWTVDKT